MSEPDGAECGAHSRVEPVELAASHRCRLEGVTGVDEQALRSRQRGRQLAVRRIGAHGRHVRARRDPPSLNHWHRRVRGQADDVRLGDRAFDIGCRTGKIAFRCQLVGILEAQRTDIDALEPADQRQRPEMLTP